MSIDNFCYWGTHFGSIIQKTWEILATRGVFYQNFQDNLRMPMTPLKADEPGAPLPSDWLATTRAPKFSFSTGSSKFTNMRYGDDSERNRGWHFFKWLFIFKVQLLVMVEMCQPPLCKELPKAIGAVGFVLPVKKIVDNWRQCKSLYLFQSRQIKKDHSW